MKLEKEVKNLHFSDKLNLKRKRFDLIFKDFLSKKELDNYIKYFNKKIKLTLEIEDPILDETERKYLSNVIRPFRDRVLCIKKEKNYYYDKQQIKIYLTDTNIPLPLFENNTMYKGMKLYMEYSLEELGLWKVKKVQLYLPIL